MSPGRPHGSDHQVRINGLDQRSLVLERLGEWMGIETSAGPGPALLRVSPEAALFGTLEAITLDPGFR